MHGKNNHIKRLYHLALFIIAIVQVASAQGFIRRIAFAGSSQNLTRAVYETSPGNYIAGGFTYENVNGYMTNRLCLIGLNSLGQIQWAKKYGNYQFQYLNNPYITRWFYKQDNHLYYTSSVLDSNNKYSGVLIKFDFNGDSLWQRIYRDTDIVVPQRVTGSVDGGFLLTGYFEHDYDLAMVIKTDANGNELWRRKIHKSDPDIEDGRAILQDTASKRIVIAGYYYLNDNVTGFASYGNILILDSLGNLQSRHNYGGKSLFQDLVQTRDKKFVSVGWKNANFQMYGEDAGRDYAVKFDIDAPANPIWETQVGYAVVSSQFACISELNNGELLIGGVQDTMELHGLPLNLLISRTKISSNGVVVNNMYYNYKTNGASQDNNMNQMCLNATTDGGAISAIEVDNSGSNYFFIVKYDSLGCDSTLAHCAAVAAGIRTLKLSDNLASVFPNPFSDQLNIKTEQAERFKATLYDATGAEIKELSLQKNQSTFDTGDLQNGLYILTLEDLNTGQQFQVKVVRQD